MLCLLIPNMLHFAIDGVALVLGGLALFGSTYLLFFALWPAGKGDDPIVGGVPGTRFLVFIPAHNEETGIEDTLASLEAVDYPSTLFDVVVIADNCSDQTARVVRSRGVECWERVEPSRRGKGQALQWALARAHERRFDAAVFIDADSLAKRDLLARLDRFIQSGAQAVQARCDFAERAELAAEFAFQGKRAETELYWLPRTRLGLALFLQGTGFCLARNVIERVPWRANSIVEDLEYSLDLLLAGYWIQEDFQTLLVTRPTVTLGRAMPQRLRWASGTLGVTLHYLPRLLAAAVRRRNWRLAEAALSLVFSNRMIVAAMTAAAFVLAVFAGTWVPFVVAFAAAAVESIYLAQIARLGGISRRAAWSLPIYAVWLLLMQILALAGLRRNLWTRAVR